MFTFEPTVLDNALFGICLEHLPITEKELNDFQSTIAKS